MARLWKMVCRVKESRLFEFPLLFLSKNRMFSSFADDFWNYPSIELFNSLMIPLECSWNKLFGLFSGTFG
ncbi:MAG: hypothetical protein H6Q14_1700 [Bacteroidetes bacterium]|nr:hypothetical protein [Bacteroidota bacterium]